jgi:protein-ribulosamine 3-kinase
MIATADIARELLALAGVRAAATPERRIGGGHGNECYAWRCGEGLIFVKLTERAALPVLSAEAQGLAELAATGAVQVPRVLAHGTTQAAAFLALEWIEAGGAHEQASAGCGTSLAALHEVTARRFGFGHDNFIGPTPQRNDWTSDWAEFFREHRLRPQLQLAARRGYRSLAARAEALLEAVAALLDGHHPAASLLHGDLWGGNWLATATGAAVLIDPAVYYGDREVDLAMTQLFGGFGAAFYRAYAARAPLPAGAAQRRELYDLYHLLNHANVFAGGYVQQAQTLMERLLARVRA